MGTFADYSGEMTIPPNLRKEFTERMMKILHYGGMMNINKVDMFNSEIYLLSPLTLSKNNDVAFYYNYFEDDSWESAGYNAKKCVFWSNKVGGREFCDVVTAAYTLYEMYTDKIGFTLVNGELIDTHSIVSWFNHLFGTKYSLKKRFRIWENFEHILEKNEEYIDNKAILHNNIYSLLPDELMMYAGGTDLTYVLYYLNGTESLNDKDIEPDSYPAHVLKCRQQLESYFENAQNKDKAKEELWSLLKKNYNERQQSNGKLQDISATTLILSARIVVILATEILGLEFWSEWKELRKIVYHDEKTPVYASPEIVEARQKGIKESIPSMRTADFLYQELPYFFYRDEPDEVKSNPDYYVSDADRLYWWDGSDEVIIDNETDRWLKTLADRHKKLLDKAQQENDNNNTEFTPRFVKFIHETDEFYKRIMPFQTMFYEFIEHSKQKEYLAAALLLQELADENKSSGKVIEHCKGPWDLCVRKVTFNPGRLRIKRYLAVMANKKLRRKYFDF